MSEPRPDTDGLETDTMIINALGRVSAGDLVTTPDGLPGPVAEAYAAMLASLRARDAELRQAGARLAAASDQRRRQAERDLHSGVQQHMALLGLKLSMLRQAVRRDPDLSESICDELTADLQNALRELRALAHGIYPVVLENEGLQAALANAAERSSIPARFSVTVTRRFPPEIEGAIYFCCAEVLKNAASHGGKDVHAMIDIHDEATRVVFEVRDDGIGFELAELTLRSGLQHITDRVTALGGELQITSGPGQGTCVRGTIPLAA